MGTYYLCIRHGLTVNARVGLNGFLQESGTSSTHRTVTTPVDRFIVPGENVLDVEILLADTKHSGAYFEAFIGKYDSPEERVALFDWLYPDGGPRATSTADRPALIVPMARAVPFVVPPDHPRPVWLDAAKENVPTDGSAELRAPIRALEDALEAGNVDGVVNALSLRSAEYTRMERFEETKPAAARAAIAQNVRAPFKVDRARDDDLVFTPIASGRAVRVTRRGGGNAIDAIRTDDPEVTYQASPLLVRHEGRYQLFS